VELWRRELDGHWPSGPFLTGSRFVTGPVDGAVPVFDVLTGEVQRLVPYGPKGSMASIADGVYLLRFEERMDAIDHEGTLLWQRPNDAQPGPAVTDGRHFLLVDNGDRRLVCLDALTGAELWTFKPPQERGGGGRDDTNVIMTGFPSLAIVGDRVIVIPNSLRVYSLALQTGEVLAAVRPEFRGWYLVTETSIYFKRQFGLSEFDHREMREVDRIEYQSDVEPLYEGNKPTVRAFWVSQESVIWTTACGSIMAVSRRPGPGGRRTVWMERLPNALIPIASPPVSYGDYLYYGDRGGSLLLYCWRSVESAS
jgi:outer membrane protein assembly factor BamB